MILSPILGIVISIFAISIWFVWALPDIKSILAIYKFFFSIALQTIFSNKSIKKTTLFYQSLVLGCVLCLV